MGVKTGVSMTNGPGKLNVGSQGTGMGARTKECTEDVVWYRYNREGEAALVVNCN